MKNSADPEGAIHQGQRASVNKTLLDLQNSSYLTQLRLIIAKHYNCILKLIVVELKCWVKLPQQHH